MYLDRGWLFSRLSAAKLCTPVCCLCARDQQPSCAHRCAACVLGSNSQAVKTGVLRTKRLYSAFLYVPDYPNAMHRFSFSSSPAHLCMPSHNQRGPYTYIYRVIKKSLCTCFCIVIIRCTETFLSPCICN
jgi:hypothetical protein